MTLPKVMDGHQALAWMVWRTKKAVKIFSGPDAEDKWRDALRGKYPPGLGPRIYEPDVAEYLLRKAMAKGELPYFIMASKLN